MRSKAPRLILSGDVRKAKPWIPWAIKYIDRLKGVLGEDAPIDKAAWVLPPRKSDGYKKIGGVSVHVQSRAGRDIIRIFAQQVEKGGCLATAEFAIDSVVGKTVTIIPDANLCVTTYLVQWGDGQFEFSQGVAPPIVHTYERAGTYNITFEVYERDHAAGGAAQNVTGDTSLDGLKNSVDSAVSHADAYSQIVAEPWQPFSVDDGRYRARYYLFFPLWRYEIRRNSFLVPLSLIAGYTGVIEQRAYIYITGNFMTYWSYDDDGASKPIIKSLSGSDMGLTTWESVATPITSAFGSLVDGSVPMIDSVAGFYDQSDADPAAMLPAPESQSQWQSTDFSYSGWESRRHATLPQLAKKLYVVAYKAGSKKTKIKPVTVA